MREPRTPPPHHRGRSGSGGSDINRHRHRPSRFVTPVACASRSSRRRGVGSRWGSRGWKGWRRWAPAGLPLLAALAPTPASAQEFLEQFSYEGLRLSGIGFEFGVVGSNRLTNEPTGAVRVDYGNIAPNVRLLFGVAYFKGDFAADEIAEFEEQLRGVVQDPTGDFEIDVGRISLVDLEGTIDLQYVLPYSNRIVPYLGLGLGVHWRNGSGDAISGTFVEDALDTVAAALNVSVGAHVGIVRSLYATADFRAGVSAELRTLAARGGLMYRFER